MIGSRKQILQQVVVTTDLLKKNTLVSLAPRIHLFTLDLVIFPTSLHELNIIRQKTSFIHSLAAQSLGGSHGFYWHFLLSSVLIESLDLTEAIDSVNSFKFFLHYSKPSLSQSASPPSCPHMPLQSLFCEVVLLYLQTKMPRHKANFKQNQDFDFCQKCRECEPFCERIRDCETEKNKQKILDFKT